jgi:hypothetical protein
MTDQVGTRLALENALILEYHISSDRSQRNEGKIRQRGTILGTTGTPGIERS